MALHDLFVLKLLLFNVSRRLDKVLVRRLGPFLISQLLIFQCMLSHVRPVIITKAKPRLLLHVLVKAFLLLNSMSSGSHLLQFEFFLTLKELSFKTLIIDLLLKILTVLLLLLVLEKKLILSLFELSVVVMLLLNSCPEVYLSITSSGQGFDRGLGW